MKSKNVKRSLVMTSATIMTILSGCSNEDNYIRNRYENIDDCLKDYTKEQCEEVKEEVDQKGTVGSGYVRSHFYGPLYHYSNFGTYGAGRTSSPGQFSSVATHAVNSEGHAISKNAITGRSFGRFAKGGFGATAHGFHGGGFGG
ncbi:MAG: hypothetical protein HQK53_09355 [Oligoflexia bacterium]|nr:hypothetical protein [Oligoflexia bacterium]